MDGGLTVQVRLSLLRPIMLEISEKQLLWSSIRGSLAEVYLDAELERLWSRCWEKVVHSLQTLMVNIPKV